MENLYVVNEYEDYGEYCYIVKADTIDEALSNYIERKREEGIGEYILRDKDNEEIREGIIKDEYGYPLRSFHIVPLEFYSSNVIFIGGYSE